MHNAIIAHEHTNKYKYNITKYRIARYTNTTQLQYNDCISNQVLGDNGILVFLERCSHCSMFWYALLYVHSSFAIILMGKRELVALLSLAS